MVVRGPTTDSAHGRIPAEIHGVFFKMAVFAAMRQPGLLGPPPRGCARMASQISPTSPHRGRPRSPDRYFAAGDTNVGSGPRSLRSWLVHHHQSGAGGPLAPSHRRSDPSRSTSSIASSTPLTASSWTGRRCASQDSGTGSYSAHTFQTVSFDYPTHEA
jgi:hypothetical protein